jgi:hypothetical protein
MAVDRTEDAQIKANEYWESGAGKEKLAKERDTTFAGEKSTVTMEQIDRLWMRYKKMMESS